MLLSTSAIKSHQAQIDCHAAHWHLRGRSSEKDVSMGLEMCHRLSPRPRRLRTTAITARAEQQQGHRQGTAKTLTAKNEEQDWTGYPARRVDGWERPAITPLWSVSFVARCTAAFPSRTGVTKRRDVFIRSRLREGWCERGRALAPRLSIAAAFT
jgi:hypothetical protein